MKVATWKYSVGENGKIMPVKAERLIDENIIASVKEKLEGKELSL